MRWTHPEWGLRLRSPSSSSRTSFGARASKRSTAPLVTKGAIAVLKPPHRLIQLNGGFESDDERPRGSR